MKLKNEVTVGIVVIAAILLMVFGAFWLSGEPWGEEQVEIVAIFREAGELQLGNPVEFRGVPIGRVTEVALSENGQGVLVTMSVRPNVELPDTPAVVLAPASLFGDWQAQIISMPTQPDLEFTTTTVEGILPGATLPDITQLTAVGARIAEDLETLAGRVELAFTEETALKIRETIDNIQTISETATGFVDQQTRAYASVSRNVLTATQNITEATASVQRVAGQVETTMQPGGEIQQILANARQASANLEELSQRMQSATEGVPMLVARADTTLANFGQLAATANQTLTAVQPQLQELGPTIAEARAAMATLQRAATRIEQGEGTLGRLIEDPALYEETQRAIVSLQRLLADLQANPGRYIGEIRILR